MPVIGISSFALEVPSLKEGIDFYVDAGLESWGDEHIGRLRCTGQGRDSIILIPGAPKKRMHHITLRAQGLDEIAASAAPAGGKTVNAPAGFGDEGLWVEDPHGLIYHLVETGADPEPATPMPFAINAPGSIVRNRKSAMKSLSEYDPVRPVKLGHVVTYTPHVLESVRFVSQVLGMGLADHPQDLVAFTCARKNSDHHLLAFAKSTGIRFHHASFQVRDPDEVGRGGRALLAKTVRGDWGFGRHTVGSNYFHYIQDPWGSWFEYYSDMDYIDDHSLWFPTNYAPEESMVNWGPQLPPDFIHNYEVESSAA